MGDGKKPKEVEGLERAVLGQFRYRDGHDRSIEGGVSPILK